MDGRDKHGHNKVNPLTIFGSQEGLVLENEGVKYVVKQIVGNGAFGIVTIATNENTNEVVAIKRVVQDRRYKNRELQMMENLNHVNVLKLKDHFYNKISAVCYHQNSKLTIKINFTKIKKAKYSSS